jgi:hypothetical protein
MAHAQSFAIDFLDDVVVCIIARLFFTADRYSTSMKRANFMKIKHQLLHASKVILLWCT